MPHYYDIRDWMDKHELNICDLDEDEKNELMEACDSATYKSDMKRFMKEHDDDFRDEYAEYCKQEKEDGNEPEEYDDWFVTFDKKEELERQFNDNRCPDDYYPIWCKAWLFPSPYNAETLNEMDIPGLVFFVFHDEVMVSLTTCGMDMSPSLFTAYYLHSDISFQKESILNKVLSSGLDYFKYVVGSEHLVELMEAVGKDLMLKYGKMSKRRYKEFDKTIKKLSEARNAGKMDQFETGILGMMAFFKTQEPITEAKNKSK